MVDPLSYFSFHDWCSVCGMVHMKEPLLVIEKNSLCGGSGFPLSLSVVCVILSVGWCI